MRLAMLVSDPTVWWQLRTAFRNRSAPSHPPTLVPTSSWIDLLERTGEDRCDLAVVDPFIGVPVASTSLDFLALEHLAAAFGRERIILFLSRENFVTRTLQHLGRAGFPFLVVEGMDDDPHSLLRALARAENRRILQAGLGVRDEGLKEGEEEGDPLLVKALTPWPPADRATKLAADLSVSLRTLERRLSETGAPNPRRCISWSRFLEASTLWAWGAGSRSRIAYLLSMSGPDALGHLCQGLTKRSLGEFWCSEPRETPLRCLLSEVNHNEKSA